jgi:hypothetical protein
MNREQWLNKVVENKDALRSIIARYHPINLAPRSEQDVMDHFITAPQAERACEIVREQIRKESLDNPEIQFDIALAKQDTDTISSLLSSAWFGIPESTSCWQIEGFGLMCDLLDDPIEQEE